MNICIKQIQHSTACVGGWGGLAGQYLGPLFVSLDQENNLAREGGLKQTHNRSATFETQRFLCCFLCDILSLDGKYLGWIVCAGARQRGLEHHQGDGAAGGGARLPLPLIQLHGQRDQVPSFYSPFPPLQSWFHRVLTTPPFLKAQRRQVEIICRIKYQIKSNQTFIFLFIL